MSEPGKQPERPGSGLFAFGKVLLWFLAIAIGLAVLAFGTCLLIFSRH
jgi:hypothetical protein